MTSDIVKELLRGTIVTVELTIAASVVATVAALIAGVARTSRKRAMRLLAGLYVEVFRGTSALVQLYLAFFVLPFAGISLSPFTAAVLAIGLNSGSYGAEIVRAGLQAVPVGLREAAIALDMPRWQRFRRVTIPSAMVVILRPAGNQYIDLLKLTSLASLVTLQDLAYVAQGLRVETGKTITVYALVLAIYICLSTLIAFGITRTERRVRRGLDAGLTRRA